MWLLTLLLIPNTNPQGTDALSQQVCGPLYSKNTTLSAAVSAAIASTVPIYVGATAGRDATDQSNWPICAVGYDHPCNKIIMIGNARAKTDTLITAELPKPIPISGLR